MVRLILSRKGFDSASGGCPSPIFPDDSMLSLPIPDETSNIRYKELKWRDVNVGSLVAGLTHNRTRYTHRAHLDPDLETTTYSRSKGWRPIFGQAGAAQGHLRNQSVQVGDLFLFFGLFRQVEKKRRKWQFVPKSSPLHVLWGWMQIGEIVQVSWLSKEELPWARYHPHFFRDHGKNNSLYIASEELVLDRDVIKNAGAGTILKYDPSLALTAPSSTKPSSWQLPRVFYPDDGKPPLTYHSNLSRWKVLDAERCHLETVSRGQEFVLDTRHYPGVLEWVKSLFARNSKLGA